MHVNSSDINAWLAATRMRPGAGAAAAGSAPSTIDDFASELSGASGSGGASAAGSASSFASLSTDLQSMLTGLQAAGAGTGAPGTNAAGTNSTGTGAPSGGDMMSQLSAMLQSYQSSGFSSTASAATDATSLTI